MKQTVLLQDGGELVWPTGVGLVPVGEHALPERMIYKHEGGPKQPRCLIEIQVWDGVPVCARAELTSKRDDRIAVRARDLKALSGMVDSVIEAAGVVWGFTRTGPTGWGLASPASPEEQRARLRSVRSSRRKVTPAFLKKIAETYKTAPTPKLESVAAAFECSERSAARYVGAAREAGLIDG